MTNNEPDCFSELPSDLLDEIEGAKQAINSYTRTTMGNNDFLAKHCALNGKENLIEHLLSMTPSDLHDHLLHNAVNTTLSFIKKNSHEMLGIQISNTQDTDFPYKAEVRVTSVDDETKVTRYFKSPTEHAKLQGRIDTIEDYLAPDDKLADICAKLAGEGSDF